MSLKAFMGWGRYYAERARRGDARQLPERTPAQIKAILDLHRPRELKRG